jgi:phage shock protein A
MAVQRAQDKTAQMQARAGAIDELMASGALDDVTGPARDDIQAELDRMKTGPDIDLELERLKGEITGGPSRQIESGASTGTAEAAQGSGAEQPQAGEGS